MTGKLRLLLSQCLFGELGAPPLLAFKRRHGLLADWRAAYFQALSWGHETSHRRSFVWVTAVYFLPLCAFSQSSIIFFVSDVVVRPSALAILSSEFLTAGVSLMLIVIVFGGWLGDFICFHFRLSAL
jgi:hypothetical protein